MVAKQREECAGEEVLRAASVGVLLLDLRNALQQAERCRLALRELGFSQERWQEIVQNVDPEMRFALRPQVLDIIVTHLKSASQPVTRKTLVRELAFQGNGPTQRIQQAITVSLRSGNLALYLGNKIGLPGWSDLEEETTALQEGDASHEAS